jgi:hypothetical protein
MDKLLQAIDSLPEISKELNGTLSKEAFLLVRNLISKHVQIEFKGKKDELMNQRLAHFKEGDWQNYVKMIGMAAQAHNTLLTQRTMQVVEHLEINKENWQHSQDAVVRDYAMAKRMQEHDLNLAKVLDAKEVIESKEEIKRIWMEKVRLEGELVLKMSGVAARSPQEA